MGMMLPYLFIFIQLFDAHAEVIFQRLTENQSLELSCYPLEDHGRLSGFHLYHRSAQSQTTLLSMYKGRKLRVEPNHRGRLRLSGGLDSLQVNVTMSDLEHSDTGLYMWELSYTLENSSQHIIACDQTVFLLVEGAGRTCQCSSVYPPLLVIIFMVVAFLLLVLTCLAVNTCIKVKLNRKPQPSAPIYEEMTRKQQTTGIAQNTQEPPLDVEEVNFPVYANPNFRQPQDTYYACPRQLVLRAT